MENQTTKPKSGKALKAIISIVFLVAIAWYFFGGGVQKQAASQMSDIEKQVALDSEKKYEIAKSGGDKIEIATHAGMVAAAYLQAKDETNYKKWKEIEKVDKKAAGLQ